MLSSEQDTERAVMILQLQPPALGLYMTLGLHMTGPPNS